MMAVPADSPSMLSSRLKALVTPTTHTTLTSASTAPGTPARCASLPIAQTATAAPASSSEAEQWAKASPQVIDQAYQGEQDAQAQEAGQLRQPARGRVKGVAD